MQNLIEYAAAAVKAAPSVIDYLDGYPRWFAVSVMAAEKTQAGFLEKITALVKRAYAGRIGTIEFMDGMADAISGSMRNAYVSAWYDAEFGGSTVTKLPDYLERSLLDTIASQSNRAWAYKYHTDIMTARAAGAPIDPLVKRAELWATRWQEAYNEAMRLIMLNTGGKLKWIEGDTQEKCDICVALDGIVAYASVWTELGVKPQSAPNEKLTCGGWRCQCRLEPTTEKQTRNAKNKIASIVGRA